MSGLAGILRFDGGPVDPAAVRTMAAAVAHRGADGTSEHVEGPIGLAHVEHRTLPGSRVVAQPLGDPSGLIWLTLDGRVHARGELVAALGPARDQLRDGSDAELVLHAYLRWGRAAIGRIVGDFALAIWDGDRGELVLARDFLGKRPLVHLRDRRAGLDSLRWGSEVAAVLADPAIRRAPNEGMVAEHLAHQPTSLTETVWIDVLRVPPAHLLVARLDGTTSLERHWSWDPSAAQRRSRPSPRRDAADQDHVEHFLATFGEAVADALEAPGPVAAELSGGVDSSSVVGMAAKVLAHDQRDPVDLYSLVFPGLACDETEHIDAVAAHLGLTANRFQPVARGAAPYLAETRRTLLPAGPPNLAMHDEELAAVRASGARVVLTGQGGDEWFTGSPLSLADDLRHGNLRGLRARAADDRRLSPARSPLHHLVRDGLLPLVGRPRRREPRLGLLPEAFRRSVDLDDRLAPTPLDRAPSLAAAHLASLAHDGSIVHSTERAEQHYAAAGLERRSPFDDRRVVELALALPDDVRRRGLATKWVVRTAVEGLVPDSVRRRGNKADFSPLFVAELELQGGAALFDDLTIAGLGWVHQPSVQQAYRDVVAASRAGRGHPLTWSLWTTLCTERWNALSCPP